MAIIGKINDKVLIDDLVFREEEPKEMKWLSGGRQQGKTYQLIKDQQKEIDIMKKYFQMIIDLGYDYDGFNNVKDLKGLIDALCKYASLGKECNTTEPIYANGNKKYNILDEELCGDDNE